MKKFQKLITLVLSLSLVLAISVPSNVNASSTTNLNKGLDIEHTSDHSWEYIQERDGEVYKIIEEIDLKTGNVSSQIMKQSNSGDFILEKIHYTSPIEDGIKVETAVGGKKISEEIIKPELINDLNQSENNNFTTFASSNDELTNWLYSYTLKSGINFPAITVGIVAAALGEFFKMPAKANFVYSSTVTIATAFIPTVYTKKVRYYKNMIGTTILAGIKDYNYVYKYSNHTGLISSGTKIDCASGFTCD